MSVKEAKPFSIGSIKFENAVFLAPMSGISDLPFRKLALRFGAGMVVSEMVASDNLCRGKHEAQLKAEGAGLYPNVVQLAGRESRWMAEGARIAEASGADMIDINMGCPSKRVTTGYSGSALMKDLDHAIRLVDAVVANAKVPVSLKMRLGWDESSMNAPELARRAENAGIRMITVHGRTRSQFFKGKANWPAIRNVTEAVNIPVIANGDCNCALDAEKMLLQTGARGVMVGRASYGKPWLAGSIAKYLADGTKLSTPYGVELKDLILEHYSLILSHYGTAIGVRAARKHLSWYLKSTDRAPKISDETRKRMLTNENHNEVLEMISNLFAECEFLDAA